MQYYIYILTNKNNNVLYIVVSKTVLSLNGKISLFLISKFLEIWSFLIREFFPAAVIIAEIDMIKKKIRLGR